MYLSAISLILLGRQSAFSPIPGLSNRTQSSLHEFHNSVSKVSTDTVVNYLYSDGPKISNSVPPQYEAIANDLVKHIFGAALTVKWKGYQSFQTITNLKKQKFVVGTIFGTVTIGKSVVSVFVNGLGLIFFVESYGIPLDASLVDRQERLVSLLRNLTSFNRDKQNFRLLGAEKRPGMRFGNVQSLSLHTVRTNESDDSAELVKTKWWSLVGCLAAPDYCVFKLSYDGWQESVIKTNFMDAFFKFPNSTLSPISSTYWTKSKE